MQSIDPALAPNAAASRCRQFGVLSDNRLKNRGMVFPNCNAHQGMIFLFFLSWLVLKGMKESHFFPRLSDIVPHQIVPGRIRNCQMKLKIIGLCLQYCADIVLYSFSIDSCQVAIQKISCKRFASNKTSNKQAKLNENYTKW